jgi:hypothetical protein
MDPAHDTAALAERMAQLEARAVRLAREEQAELERGRDLRIITGSTPDVTPRVTPQRTKPWERGKSVA